MDTQRLLRRIAAGFMLVFALAASPAGADTFMGSLDDCNDPALVASDLGAPVCTDDFAIANNVALYALSILQATVFTFESTGYAAGGVDPYLTIFSGTGGTATFLASNYDIAFTVGGDFVLSVPLTPGDYTIAISAFANMSFAENTGSGTLGDGFIGLGFPATPNFSYVFTAEPGTSVPEPATALLLATAALSLALVRRRRPRAAG